MTEKKELAAELGLLMIELSKDRRALAVKEQRANELSNQIEELSEEAPKG